MDKFPQILKGILKVGKVAGVDKLTKTKLELDQLKKWHLGTTFLDVTIERLTAAKFEDQCMTPKDKNMKRECKITLVFPRLDLKGKVHWSKNWILNWLYVNDGRYETLCNI